MINKQSIGRIIKSLRVNKNLTQEELAEKIDISKNYLSKVERGISVLNAETFLKMAKVLDFTLDDFGLNCSTHNNTLKNKLIAIILSANEKEVKSYLEIINSLNKILKI